MVEARVCVYEGQRKHEPKCPERGITKAIGVEDGLVEVGFVGNSRSGPGLTVVLPRIVVEQTVPQPTPYQKRRFWTFWPVRAAMINALGRDAEGIPPVVLVRVSRRR